MTTCSLVILWIVWLAPTYSVHMEDSYDTAKECRIEGAKIVSKMGDKRPNETITWHCLPVGVRP